MTKRRRKPTPVVNLFSRGPVPQFNGEVQKALVERLEEMTRRAKAGWLRGICMGLEYSDQSYTWEGVGIFDKARMAGALGALRWELEKGLAEEGDGEG